LAERDEKLFPALPQKRQRAREQGQVARSRDLTGAVAFAGFAVLVAAFLRAAAGRILQDFTQALAASAGPFSAAAPPALRLMSYPLLVGGALALLAIVAATAQGGFVFAPSRLGFAANRLSPASYFQRTFSAAGAVELAKATVKIVALVLMAWSIALGAERASASGVALSWSVATLAAASGRFLWSAAALGLVVAAADYGHKLYLYEADLRMTRQEFLDELKQEQGNPQVKRALRNARRRNFKRMRGIHQAATATVVLTNPTHYAVALRYRRGFDQAPLVVAKGAGENAARIITIARLAAVPVVPSRMLARALFRSVEVGDQIPRQLYRAVAEVLATIMRAEARRRRSPEGSL